VNQNVLVSDGKKRLDHDADSQLITVTFTNTVQSKFVYDGLARMRIRREYTWQTNQWKLTNEVRYVYDHNLVIQERDSNNVPKLTYTRGLDLSRSLQGAGGIGGLLALTQNGTTNQHFYYDDDGAGNITGLFDTNLNLVAYYLYDPFGNPTFASGSVAGLNRCGFSSKEFMANPRVAYFGGRFYDPGLQRFLNQDPIGENAGINLYPYVENDPVNRIDPFGLQSPQAAVVVALGSGDVAQMAALLEIGGDIGLTAAQQAALRSAIAAAAAAAALGGDRCESREHTKGKRPSTAGKHEEGEARKGRDQGGEKGDARRDPKPGRPEPPKPVPPTSNKPKFPNPGQAPK